MTEESCNALADKLNYWVDIRVLIITNFGAPKNRERVFIVGFNKEV